MKAITFPFRIGAHGGVSYTLNSNKVWMDRVRAVLNTQVGDRVMRPSFGLDSNAVLLNQGTPAEQDLPSLIRRAFSDHLPTLSLTDVKAKIDPASATLVADVVFTCPDRTSLSTSVTFDNGSVTSDADPYEVIQ